MTSKMNQRSNASCNSDNCHQMHSMVRDSPLLTTGDLARAHSCLHGRSPRGASHGWRGNGVTRLPESGRSPQGAGPCKRSRSPWGAGHGLHGNGVTHPSKSGRSPQGVGHGLQGDEVTLPPNCTMMPSPPPVAHPAPSDTDMVPAPMVAAANCPPEDEMSVYTITS
jgi:hypothetical protein